MIQPHKSLHCCILHPLHTVCPLIKYTVDVPLNAVLTKGLIVDVVDVIGGGVGGGSDSRKDEVFARQGGKSDESSVLLLLLLRGSILLRPLASGLDGSFLVFFPGFGDFGGERVVGVGGAEEGLDGEEDGADLKGGGPVIYGKEVSL